MILVTGVLVAIFVVPDPWTIPIIVLAAALEITETAFTFWWSRRAAPKVGPETLIGATGRAVTACRPDGTVRVRGEVWRARCDRGVDAHASVRIIRREGLLLVVEPIEAATSPHRVDGTDTPDG